MRVAELQFIHARIPLKRRISHASHSRDQNETILVRCQLDDGSVGWGEGLPREYVTGETIDSAWQHLQVYPRNSLAEPFNTPDELAQRSATIQMARAPGKRACFGNAARCALELAILDAGCRGLGISLSEFIQQLPLASPIAYSTDTVQYSAVLTGASKWKTAVRAGLFRASGFRQCKIKVGMAGQDDREILNLARRILGPRILLRVDANEAWAPQELKTRLDRLEPFRLQSVEQPVAHAQIQHLKGIRRESPIPILLDESLCDEEDARRAIENDYCSGFNLRLSKCGGVFPMLSLALQAVQAELQIQLGCQVGETGILSAAGRHFATSIGGLVNLEGSFDRLLVREPLTEQDLTFGWGGRAPALTGPGLGISLNSNALQRVTRKTATYLLK